MNVDEVTEPAQDGVIDVADIELPSTQPIDITAFLAEQATPR